MEQDPQTFPTLRRWQGMSEHEQDALLDKIEARRRWQSRSRTILALACIAAIIVFASIVAAFA
jgi:hypothetical protein